MLRTLEPQNGAKKMNAEAQSRYPCSYEMKSVYTQITDEKGGEVETLIALITFVWNFRSFLFHAGGENSILYRPAFRILETAARVASRR